MKKKIFNSELLAGTKLGFREDEAAQVLRSRQLVSDMQNAGWIKPIIHRHKLKIFDRAGLLRAWNRILAGEHPPHRKRRAPTAKPLRAACDETENPLT